MKENAHLRIRITGGDESNTSYIVLEEDENTPVIELPHQYRYAALQALAFLFQTFMIVDNLLREVDDQQSAVLWFAYLKNLNLLITFLHESAMSVKTVQALCNNEDIRLVQDKSRVSRALAIDTSVCNAILHGVMDRSGDPFYDALFNEINMLGLMAKTAAFNQSFITNYFSREVMVPLAFAAAYFASNYVLVTQFGMPETSPVLNWKAAPDISAGYAAGGWVLFGAIPGLYSLVRSCIECVSTLDQYELSTAAPSDNDEATPPQLLTPQSPLSWPTSPIASSSPPSPDAVLLSASFNAESSTASSLLSPSSALHSVSFDHEKNVVSTDLDPNKATFRQKISAGVSKAWCALMPAPKVNQSTGQAATQPQYQSRGLTLRTSSVE